MNILKGRWQNLHPVGKLCQFLLLMLLGTCIVMGIWVLLFHGRQDISSLKVMQMLQTVGTFMLPCFVAAYLWSKYPLRYLRLSRCPDWKSCLMTIVLMLSASPGINLLSWLNQQLCLPEFLSGLETLLKQQEDAAAVLTEQFIRANSFGMLSVNIVLMALLPALSEELCFRGIIQQLFCPIDNDNIKGIHRLSASVHVSIWATAIVFSAIHFQFYGFIPRMLMGALFGYLLVWSGSLWLPILAHFTNNAFAVILYNVFYMRDMDAKEIDDFGTDSTLWIGIVSIMFACILIVCLQQYLTRKRPESE